MGQLTGTGTGMLHGHKLLAIIISISPALRLQVSDLTMTKSRNCICPAYRSVLSFVAGWSFVVVQIYSMHMPKNTSNCLKTIVNLDSEPDQSHNLINFSLFQFCFYFLESQSQKLIQTFLSNVVHRQTHKDADNHIYFPNFVGGRNNANKCYVEQCSQATNSKIRFT